MTLEGVRLTASVANVTPEVAAVEREVVRNELRQRNETGIYGSILSYVQAAVFPADHPYARPVIGSHESLSATTLEDAQRFVEQSYRPDNATLVIVGDVDLQAVGGVVEQSLPPGLRAGAPGRAFPARLDPVAPEPPAPPPAGPLPRYEQGVPRRSCGSAGRCRAASTPRGTSIGFVAAIAQSQLAGAFFHDPDIGAVQVQLVPGKEAAMLLCRVVLLDATNPERSVDHVLDRLVEIWDWDSAAPREDEGSAREAALGRSLQGDALPGARARLRVPLQRSAVTGMMLDAESLVDHGYERAELTHFTGDPAAYFARPPGGDGGRRRARDATSPTST